MFGIQVLRELPEHHSLPAMFILRRTYTCWSEFLNALAQPQISMKSMFYHLRLQYNAF